MSKPPDADESFVRHLRSLAEDDDRAALARLRRGLGKEPGSVAGMCPLVQPWLPAGLPRWHEDACYLIAALFAVHPEPGGRGSLGLALRRLADGPAAEGVERRFVALLASHRDDLPDHLRHAVALLKAKSVPVDWRRLLADLRRWGHPGRFVQRRWARDFWAPPAAVSAAVSESQPPEEPDR